MTVSLRNANLNLQTQMEKDEAKAKRQVASKSRKPTVNVIQSAKDRGKEQISNTKENASKQIKRMGDQQEATGISAELPPFDYNKISPDSFIIVVG
jgi:hypothetical protein